MWSYVRKSVPSALVLAVAIAATGATPHPLGAQTAKDQIAFGDREYAEHKTQSALDSYMKPLSLEAKNYEALWKASRAAGRKALTPGTRDRIKYANIVRLESLDALKADSLHSGALHVLGMWSAEIMRINGLARAFAKAFLGADVFALASWNEAQRLLELAVKVDSTRIVHRLDLAAIYADHGDKARAREQYEIIAKAPLHDATDPLYKEQAAERLRKL